MKVLVDIGLTVRVMFFSCLLTGNLRKFWLRYFVSCTILLVSTGDQRVSVHLMITIQLSGAQKFLITLYFIITVINNVGVQL